MTSSHIVLQDFPLPYRDNTFSEYQRWDLREVSPHLIRIGEEKGTGGNWFCKRQRVFLEAAQLLFEGWQLNSRAS